MRISDWSSDVCSSDLVFKDAHVLHRGMKISLNHKELGDLPGIASPIKVDGERAVASTPPPLLGRSEEHTSELQSLMRISYAVFCLKKKKISRSTSSYHHISNNKNTQLYTDHYHTIHNKLY